MMMRLIGQANLRLSFEYDGQPQFMAALGALSQMPEMGAFFGIIDASAYQATIVE